MLKKEVANLFLKKINKKGVSPIIATVLLIAFAVALGAVVMNWGKGFVENTAKTTEEKTNLELACQQELQLSVKKISNIPKICYDSGNKYVEVMLENSGTVNITGMQYALFDSTGDSAILKNTTLSVGPGEVTRKVKIYYNDTTLSGSIVQIEFIPMIKPKGSITSQLCPKNNLVVNDISSTCS